MAAGLDPSAYLFYNNISISIIVITIIILLYIQYGVIVSLRIDYLELVHCTAMYELKQLGQDSKCTEYRQNMENTD